MRPINTLTLCAFAGAIIAPPALAMQANVFMKFDGVVVPGAVPEGKGGGWIEIQGWDWGETQACCKGIDYLVHVTPMSSRDPDRPLVAGRIPNAGVEREIKKSGEKGSTEGSKISERPLTNGVRVAAGDINADGRASVGGSEKLTVGGNQTASGQAGWYRQNPVVVLRATDEGAPRAGTTIGKAIGNASADDNEASGQATGKRTHKPLRMRAYADQSAAPAEKRQHGWVTVSTPLDRGAVRVKVKVPWAGCAVGARYPRITLGDGAGSTQLHDVTVASCARESVSLNYAKVIVRGWDPAKKEE